MELKRVLIISPYFPPSNAADMHRVRTSLPYFKEFGWEAEVVCVSEKYSAIVKDDLLLDSVPGDIKIHLVNAFSNKGSAKIGLGSLALRSFWFYLKKVNGLLSRERYDLVYFSTTQFPLCILGAYWKKRFQIPYVIDMQDPWHSEYYQDKPKSQRPPKYWFSYRLHKFLEPIAMKKVDGLISVSERYLDDLVARYPRLLNIPAATVTFGAFQPDTGIAADHQKEFDRLLEKGFTNIVYIGRGGTDMHKAIRPVFVALKKGLKVQHTLFGKLRFYFIGTSYAPQGKGAATILPLAKQYGVEGSVIEMTDRISYYHTLVTLSQADALFIPGSDDPKYTASKIYPYMMAKKPLLAIFDKSSSAVEILNKSAPNAVVLTFDQETEGVRFILSKWAKREFDPVTLTPYFERFGARQLTCQQTLLFRKAIVHVETEDTNA